MPTVQQRRGKSPFAGAQGSGGSSEMANGHSSSGDLLQAVGGLRFSMQQQPGSSNDLRAEVRSGDLPHAPGSPSTSGRGAEPATLSREMQHGRSESLGSDTHLPVGGMAQAWTPSFAHLCSSVLYSCTGHVLRGTM